MGATMILGNAYHLHLRPGDDVVRAQQSVHALEEARLADGRDRLECAHVAWADRQAERGHPREPG